MDWTALGLSLRLGLVTVALLLPLSFLLARWLAFGRFRGRGLVEALVALPLILPPTVVGFYLLVAFGRGSPSSRFLSCQRLTLAGLPPKRSPASRSVAPASTAARKRVLNLSDSAFDMPASLPSGRQCESYPR